ncbi:hypothetical protein RJ640_003235 [Escallonia rubra]|uniref:Uncharacterized protein n=1 Tax=Escallonia rubra TaxID=112253 RepID=A0AA88UDZ3_9ASTE|nr:hypothetical protein RJ640_003235 [Escallonia rubra]
MGSLQILNTLQAKVVPEVLTEEGQVSTGKGLPYVKAKMNGKPVQLIFDTGTTHNFVTMEEAKRLGLKVVGSQEKRGNLLGNPKDGRLRLSTEPLPKEIEEVLEVNKDVMPPELPKRLPHRRDVDNEIELKPGTKPLFMAPYLPQLSQIKSSLDIPYLPQLSQLLEEL